ncbi:two-component regulator propeller domain-containing protein [Bacteroidota bacterium]
MIRPFIFFLLLFIFSSSIIINAQNGIKFYNYSVENGLANNEVNAFCQDNDGYIWIATSDGLSKFDGYTFTNYITDIKDSLSISNNLVKCLLIDHDGNLWAGTQDGLNRYIKEIDGFENYYVESIEIDYDVHDLDIDIDSSIVIASSFGVHKHNKETNSLEAFFADKLNTYGAENTMSAIEVLENGDVLIGAMWKGFYYYHRQKNRFIEYVPNENDPYSVSSLQVRSLAVGVNEEIWIGNYWEGLQLFDPKTENFYSFPHDPDNPNSPSDNNIFRLAVDKDNNLFIGTENGLTIYNPSEKIFTRIYNDEFDDETISENKIRGIFQDIQGSLWIGHLTKGISFSTYNYSKGFTHVFNDPLDENSLSYNVVAGILEDSKGDYWFATDGGGLNHYIKRADRYIHYRHDPNDNTSIGHDAVLCVFEDSDGNIWTGSYMGGLGLLDVNTGRFYTYRNDPNNPNSIAYDDVRFITEDHNKNLWIAAHGRGISKFDRVNNVFTNFTVNAEDPDKRILNEWIWPLLIIGDNLWVGSVDGLYSINLITEKVGRSFSKIPNDPTSLSNNRIQCLFYDSKGNFWVGTEGGLNKFNTEDSTFTVYTKNDGLANDFIKSILEDEKGNLWISTNKGLCKFNAEVKTFKNYDSNDGLQGDIFVPRSAYKLNSGEFMFGGLNGYNIFNPKEIKDNEFIPNVILTNFKLFNKDVVIGGKKSPLKKHISQSEEIELRYKQNVITFEYVGLNYIQPEKNQYAYIMEGFDEEWNYVGTERKASYTNLDPGEYIFRVKASNNDGIWNKEGASIGVVVIPPYYRTFWFFLIIFIIISSIIITIVKVRSKIIKEEKRMLEEKIQEAVDQVEEKKQEIESQNQALLEKHKEDEIRNWASEGMAKFGDLLREDNKDLEKFSFTIISELSNYLDAQLGAIFIKNDDDPEEIYYELKGSIAYGKQKVFEKKISIGEGLIGSCAFDKKTIYYTEIPEEYVKISSGLGETPPKSLLIVPCTFNEDAYAIIELASLELIDEYKINFLEELGEKLASTVSIVKNNERTDRLLKKSKEQANELITSEEELRQNLEEMRATQEQSDKREKDLLEEIEQLKEENTSLRKKLREVTSK